MVKRNRDVAHSPARQAVNAGWDLVADHPLFAPLANRCSFSYDRSGYLDRDGWATVTPNGYLTLHPNRIASSEEWAYVFAHCLLHLGFGHFQTRESPLEWNIACDCVIASFLERIKFGMIPPCIGRLGETELRDEDGLYLKFCAAGIPAKYRGFGCAGSFADMLFSAETCSRFDSKYWAELLSRGLREGVGGAVRIAGGHQSSVGTSSSEAAKARNWFMSFYPMLGALAAAFDIVEDREICRRLQISIAAVDSESREIYINPQAGLTEEECRFVIAHEILHAGLRHQTRRAGRDPFLWNVACDYVINGWLMEMGIGDFPRIGGLLDRNLKGQSAEAIYDRIVNDLRLHRKVVTLRGAGLGDMLERRTPDWQNSQEGRSLDVFYRECMAQGLTFHQQHGRGLLPLGLIEEIRALSQPPIPWDVQLARWFDERIPNLERCRTWSRASRRQSSTTDIPRAVWQVARTLPDSRTFGVLLDTSGSMDRKVLAKALGAVASYTASREVAAVRVVFCDADFYDQGYISFEEVAGRVRVRGRGGTILQPAVDFFEAAEDFPKDAPLLIITDGACDRIRIGRTHAFLLPAGYSLPFVPNGPIFRMV